MSKYQKFNILSSKKSGSSPTVDDAVSNFLISKKAMNCTPKTIDSYTNMLKPFSSFCKLQGVKKLEEVDNFFVDSYLAEMSSRGHNDGGMFAYYRGLRTFMRWSWDAYNFKTVCPTDLSKVKAPPANPIPGVPADIVQDMLEEAKHTEYPQRDIAFIMFLVDTGARKQEAANIRLKDVNLDNGDVFIECGKGRKNRNVHIGSRTRKAITEYLKTNPNDKPDDKLWVSKEGYAMTADGLSEIIRRIQKNLNIDPIYSLHDFRRFCAVSMYRASHDLMMVSLYLGHTSVDITRRYLNLTEEDLHTFGETFSNMDKLSRERPKRRQKK